MVALFCHILLAQAAVDERAEYLVVAHDSLAEAIQPLADWKRQKGYRTRVVRISEIGGDLRAFLRKEKPTYVLLVGDAPLVPGESVKRTRRIYTDHYYGCLDDGDDWLPDAYAGRLPARTSEECALMVRKILTYEKKPDPGAFRRALVAAEFPDHDNDGYENGGFTESAVAAKAYLEHLGVATRTAFQRKPDSTALPLRHMKSHTGEWDLRWAGGDVIKGFWPTVLHPDGQPYVVPIDFLPDEAAFRRTVTDAVNEGVSVVQFALHGLSGATVYPKYDRAAVRGLANGDRLPLVLVFACLTGSFKDDECFAEAWLRNPKGGAVAVIASSGGSWGGYNEWLAYGIWDGLARGFFAHLSGLDGYKKIAYAGNKHGPGRRLGPLLAYGKQALLDLYRGETQREWMTRDTFETYNLLGDPELELRLGKQLPLEVAVSGSTVTVRRDGKPLAGARVALPGRSVLTDATGRAALEGRGTLTVTAVDSVPFVGARD